MIPKRLEEITEADLCRLRDNLVAEGKSIEYKRDLPGSSDGERIKFLRAVTSFSNTVGGDLIYGIEASNGVPVAVPGIDAQERDKLTLRMDNLVRDAVQPRLRDVSYQPVPLGSGRVVWIVRTQRSWNGPHRVTLAGHGHFYGRNSAGGYQMDTDQLRAAFTEYGLLTDRIRRFRQDRLIEVRRNPPVPLVRGAVFVLHIVPASAFASRDLIPVAEMRRVESGLLFLDAATAGSNQRTNLDGRLLYDPRGAAYSQIFRSGAIEVVHVFEPNEDGRLFIFQDWCEWHTWQRLPYYVQGLLDLGASLPMYVFLSYFGVERYQLWNERGSNAARGGLTADREALALPEVVIESDNFEAGEILHPAFDMVWNAFNYPDGTPNLNSQGAWTGRRM